MNFIQNRLNAAKAWWEQEKRKGDEARGKLTPMSRKDAVNAIGNFKTPQQPQQEFGDMPVVQAFKQRSLRPFVDQFKDPRKLATNFSMAISDPYNYMGGGFAGTIAGKSATGFAKAPNKFSALWDKKPRFEIDDSAAKMLPVNIKKSAKLSDVMDHKELFNNYPDLANIYVAKKRGGVLNAGEYIPNMNMIRLSNTKSVPSNFDTNYRNLLKKWEQKATEMSNKGTWNDDMEKIAAKELRSFHEKYSKIPEEALGTYNKQTLLHEIQHAIQQREGFARGGSPEGGRLPSGIMDAYNRLAGEIEARSVANRANMPMSQRLTASPYIDQGIPMEDVITRFDDGINASIRQRNPLFNKAIQKKVLQNRIQGKSIPYITQRMDREDRGIMTDFIDQTRLRKPTNVDLEINARRMASAMGFNPDQTNSQLAKVFEAILSNKLK